MAKIEKKKIQLDTMSKREIAEAAVDQLRYIMRYADTWNSYGYINIIDENAESIIEHARETINDIEKTLADLKTILNE